MRSSDCAAPTNCRLPAMTRMSFAASTEARAPSSKFGSAKPSSSALLGGAVLSVALLLSGCGGGGDLGVYAGPGAGIGIDVSVAGSTYAHAAGGQVLNVAVSVGQSVAFDANEPVVWSFSVNGSPLFLNGTTVDVGGVTITQAQFDPSRVVLQSTFYGPALLPIDVVLVATSTIDRAQVSTIRLSLR